MRPTNNAIENSPVAAAAPRSPSGLKSVCWLLTSLSIIRQDGIGNLAQATGVTWSFGSPAHCVC